MATFAPSHVGVEPTTEPAPARGAIASRPFRARRAGASTHGGGPDRSLAAELELTGFVLHRRIAHPGLPTIDHVVVAPSGVWIVARQHVDCARVSVRPRLAGRGSLRVGGRDRTALIDDLARQVTAVRGLLFDALDLPVQAALCLPGAEFPLLRTLSVDDHLVLRPAQLIEQLRRRGPLRRTRCREVAELLDRRLG